MIPSSGALVRDVEEDEAGLVSSAEPSLVLSMSSRRDVSEQAADEGRDTLLSHKGGLQTEHATVVRLRLSVHSGSCTVHVEPAMAIACDGMTCDSWRKRQPLVGKQQYGVMAAVVDAENDDCDSMCSRPEHRSSGLSAGETKTVRPSLAPGREESEEPGEPGVVTTQDNLLKRSLPVSVCTQSDVVRPDSGDSMSRRRRGERGRGARARGRIRLMERRKCREFVCATGDLADACTMPSDILDVPETEPYTRGTIQSGECVHCLESEESSRLRLALSVQRKWRARARGGSENRLVCEGPPRNDLSVPSTSIELGWLGGHRKKHGDLVSHVRFLQWIFRTVEYFSPGSWALRRVSSLTWAIASWCRRRRFSKCGLGQTLANDAEFDAQKDLADEMLDWYGQYVAIVRKFLSNTAPGCFDNFCGGGAVAEGVRRAGGVPHGLDIEDQPAFKCRFAPEHFVQGDGTDWSLVRSIQKRFGLRVAGGSPPCKFYSTARQKGESKQPPLIDQTRDMLNALFEWWWIENVMGAQNFMSASAVEIDGPFFGLRVFRSRLFETNFPLHVDRLVRVPADRLRARCCLGKRSRWRPFDEFGRPYSDSCCSGNVFIPIGDSPWRCTHAECASAMGVDVGHMPYDRLAQAVPPAYSQWVFGQLCMQWAHSEFGCPVITFDEMKAQPAAARRTLAQWLVGAGADNPSAGMTLVPRLDLMSSTSGDGEDSNLSVLTSSVITDKDSFVVESTFRELYYAHFGGYDSQWSECGQLSWLQKLRDCSTLNALVLPTVEQLVGSNTYIEVSRARLSEILELVVRAVTVGGRGTRATIVTLAQDDFPFGERFEAIDCTTTYGGADALAEMGLVAAWCGRRASPTHSSMLVHESVEHGMDPRDLDGFVEDKLAKSVLTWSPISHDPSLWREKDVPADVKEIMTEGVRISMDADSSCFQTPQYPFPDDQALMESIMEADRALTVGHMEYVPDALVEQVARDHIVHPWLMVWQGKWRLCQDYSDGTNRAARSGPFALPSAWDTKKILKPGSHMSKYDLRDFFWTIPVHPESRCRLVMRHPGTGRLMWCRSLPFGYLDSPRQACRVSEALAGVMRHRAAGKGIYFLCYVDDYLIVGDTYELTREGERIFEEVMAEFGMQWAPSKQRGPVQCLEFLGLLISNVAGHRCIGLSKKRQLLLRKMIDEWMARHPAKGESQKVEPRELAVLLGHLVFASQVVPGGRTYMQNMLSAFGGLDIDWQHGRVRMKGGHWDLVTLSREFWLDLEWWSDHLEMRNCVSLEMPSFCEAMITGTDASDWGVGTVAWLDGHKEECNLEFTRAERRRPINFRELLGIVRVTELHGHRLRGCKVMIETDNMAARGAAEKLASVAASMQEMLRRLYSVAERWGIIVVPVHTPGAKLYRPDQTSRGDPIEEPRLRLNAQEFHNFDVRFGPFTEFVGAERRHARSDATLAGSTKIWMHPAHNTVGSALRLLGERLSGYDGDETSHRGPPPSGVVIVPYAPDAQWWGLTRHFVCVGRWEPGSEHLEMNQLGRWRSVPATRASLALIFPRSVGASMKKVELPLEMYIPGYAHSADFPWARGLMLPLVAGSFVYSPGVKGTRGELLMVWHSFDPTQLGRELDENGELRVSCAELLYVKSKGVSNTYKLDRRGHEAGGSFAPGQRCVAWELAVGLLFTVDHLVSVDGPLVRVESLKPGTSPHFVASKLEERVFTFDYVRAELEVKKIRERFEPDGDASPSEDLNQRLAAIDLSPRETSVEVGAFAREATGGNEGVDLEAARRSADEAAGMKKTPARLVRVSQPAKPPARMNTRVTVCRYSAQRCEGCDLKFVFGEHIIPGCRAMVHPGGDCLEAARAKSTARQLEGGPRSTAVVTSTKEAKMASFVEGDRLIFARECLNGACQVKDEAKVMCLRGCGRGIHLVGCLRTSSAYAAAGRLICVTCRLTEIMESGNPNHAPSTVVQMVTLAMIGELTSGAVSTAAGRNQFVSLERRWASESFDLSEARSSLVKLPRHNIESFVAFMWWLVTEADRARSFATTMRTAGAVMSMLELTDWTKTTRVKAIMKEITRKTGMDCDPCTQTSRRIIRIMMEKTIQETCSQGSNLQANALLAARTETLLVLELLAGLRVGEATSSGDLHGLDANDLAFLTPLSSEVDDGLGETVEVKILDSKTGLGRHAAFVATTQGEGKLPGAKILRNWIALSKLATSSAVEGGFTVVRPNYWVARVSLSAMSKSRFEIFLRAIEQTRCEVIAPQASCIIAAAKRRYTSRTLDDSVRYVNIAGGPRTGKDTFGEDLTLARDWLEREGFGNVTCMVPGPLVRSTAGKTLTHMPLATGSTYSHLIKAMKAAYVISSGMEEPDMEFDLQGLEAPHFGNHSLRRHADKVARESLNLHEAEGITEVTKEVIDYFFGWLLKEMSKVMQLHYAGLDRPSRRILARVTMFF